MNSNFEKLYGSDVLEAVKTLRTNLEFAGMDKPIRSISISSTRPSEGKTTISLLLGIAMGESNKKTLIVENDFRHPQLAKALEVRIPLGITDLLTGNSTLDEVIYETGFSHLSLLNVGRRIANPVEVLGSNRYAGIMKEVYDRYDFIIYDTPPIGLFIDGAIIASKVDGCLMVINSGAVPSDEVKTAVDQLQKAKAHILGVVLNGVDQLPRNSYNYYKYRYINRDKDKDNG